jgi:hypothetical protein
MSIASMLKKKKPEDEIEHTALFPKIKVPTVEEPINSIQVEKHVADTNNKNIDYRLIIDELKHDADFRKLIKNEILSDLEKRYDFFPTDKYNAEVEQKKQYLSKLEGYLSEKKTLHQEADTELKKLLEGIQQSITSSLTIFEQGLHERLNAAENKYGVEELKKIIEEDVKTEKN